MSDLLSLGRRVRMLLSRVRFRRDLDEEMQLHLELHEQRLRDDGLSPEEARMAARRRFGSVLRWREESADAWGWRLLDDLGRDLRQGLRALWRTPVFTSVAILTMALGIGANTAIFSVVNGVLLRPLAYPRPAQLMFLDSPTGGSSRSPVSVPEYLEFQRFNSAFAEVGAFRTGETNFAAGDRALRVRSATVDAQLLKALGVQPAQGRLFTGEETGVLTPPPVAVISYELWRSAFGEQPIVGQGVDVGGVRHEIVGIMARGADLMDTHTEIWLPLGFAKNEPLARGNHNLHLIGRLKEGVTVASARAELSALIETWAERAGMSPAAPLHAGHFLRPPTKGGDGHVLRMTPLAEQVLGRASRSIWVLQAAVGLVLLIACANVANLLLARGEARQREFAVLTALGASRGRLLRKALTESVILSVAGGALGVLLARAGVAALIGAYPSSLPRIGEVSVDSQVMLVSLAVAVACGLLFGLAPMMHTRSDTTAATLKAGPRGSSGTTRHHVRRGLVVAETALAVIVVVGAGLLLRTVSNLTGVDAGFDRSRLVTFSITPPVARATLVTAVVGVPSAERTRKFQRVVEQLRALPGVSGASAMTSLPLERPFNGNQSEIANTTATEPFGALDYQRVMSGFFETMGVPIVQGRGFTSSDAASEGWVTVVNESLADTYWKGLNPIGQRLRPRGDRGQAWFTVIGVAKDVKQTGVDQPVGPEAYIFVDQHATDSPATWIAFSPSTVHVVVKTTLPLSTLAPAIERVVRDVDPAVPVARLREMDGVFAESIRAPRLLAQLLGGFAGLALLLATIGTYGVLACMVTERRREIGIRIALGAARSTVVGQVMRQGLKLTMLGVVVGLAGALALNRLIGSLLFGVQPTDAPTMAAAIATIALIAAVACCLPAWQASRLDPNVVLRAD